MSSTALLSPQRTPLRRTLAVAAGSVLLLGTALGAGNAGATGSDHSHGKSPFVVADHLDNPRQLAVGPGGSLLVAETGSGGTNCQGEGEDAQCFGATSKITKIRAPFSKHPQESTVIDGLLSFAGPDGSFANGLASVGAGHGRVFSIGSSAPESGPPPESTGELFYVKHGQPVGIADITAYENANDPDGQGAESNPYSVLVQSKRILVADAAANAVLSVNKRGKISVFHVFPNIETGPCAGQPNDAGTTGCDFVPTALAQGPGGSVYVTGLASEAIGEGRVVKLSKHGKVLKTWSGFTTPVGIAVRSNGTFYVSELFANADFENPDPPNIGLVTKVTHGKHTSRVVPLPAGLAIIGSKLYVSAYSVAPASGLFGNPDWNGQVWRLRL